MAKPFEPPGNSCRGTGLDDSAAVYAALAKDQPSLPGLAERRGRLAMRQEHWAEAEALLTQAAAEPGPSPSLLVRTTAATPATNASGVPLAATQTTRPLGEGARKRCGDPGAGENNA